MRLRWLWLSDSLSRGYSELATLYEEHVSLVNLALQLLSYSSPAALAAPFFAGCVYFSTGYRLEKWCQTSVISHCSLNPFPPPQHISTTNCRKYSRQMSSSFVYQPCVLHVLNRKKMRFMSQSIVLLHVNNRIYCTPRLSYPFPEHGV